MTTEQLPDAQHEVSEWSLPPVVMWHYRGNPNAPQQYNATTRRVARGLMTIMATAVDSIILSGSIASGIGVRSDWNLTRFLHATDVPHPAHWTAYTCSAQDAERTDELIKLTYGAWLATYGNGRLAARVTQQAERTFGGIQDVDPELLNTQEIMGRLVMPDIISDIVPGTSWVPSLATMDRPGWPAMPDEHTKLIWRMGHE